MQTPLDVSAKTRPSRRAKRFKINWTPYLLLVPMFAMLAVFRYYPAVSAIYHSFTRWNGLREPRWVGLQNYTRLLRDEVFLVSLKNMVIYTCARTALVVMMAFLAAELVYSLKSPAQRMFWKVLFVIPLVVPRVVVLLVWAFVFNTQSGILNNFLGVLGLEAWQQPWLGQSSTALWSLIFIGFPFVASFEFIIYITSLEGLPGDVLDAAKVDGCGIWRRMLYIDFPLMRGPIMLTLILLVLEGIQILEPQLVLTQGGPGTSTESPANLLYTTAFTYQKFGYATSIGVVMLLIGLVFSYYSIRLRYQGAADVDT